MGSDPGEFPLDRAYAFVLSDNVARTAMELRDRLVTSCGFDAQAASDALRVRVTQTQTHIPFGRIPLAEPPAPERLPDALRTRVTFDPATRTLQVSGEVSHRDAVALRDAVRSEQDRSAVDAFWQEMRPAGTTSRPLEALAPSIFVPRLALAVGDRRTLFEPEELDEYSWNLDACDPSLSREEFADDVRVGAAATIDLQGEAVVSASAGEVRLRQLELIGEGDDWSDVELTRWLDRELHRDDTFLGLAKSESQPWLRRVVDGLVRGRHLSLPVVVRRRHELAQLLRGRVAAHGRARAREAAQALIRNAPQSIETSPALTFEMSEAAYAPYALFERHDFHKHAFDRIAAMNGEEAECAARIDRLPAVRRWARNPDRETQGGFWLPKSPGKFFPDFIVQRTDDAIVLVEYKMGKLSSDPEEQHKKAMGELWAARSAGRCRFGWVVDRDWGEVDRVLREQAEHAAGR